MHHRLVLFLTLAVITVCLLFTSCADTGPHDFAADEMRMITPEDILEAYICSGTGKNELTEEDRSNLLNALHTVQADQFRDKKLHTTEDSVLISLADGDMWTLTLTNSRKYVSVSMNDHSLTGASLKSPALCELIAALLDQTS